MSFSRIPDYLKEDIHPGDSMELAGRKIIVDLMRQITEREEGTKSGEDIEDLHRMRVAIRKLRSALRAFRIIYGKCLVKPMQDHLKLVADVLGEVRDIDTFVEFLREAEEDMPAFLQTAVDHLIETRLEKREEGLKKIRETLDGSNYQDWKEDLFERLADHRFQGFEPAPVRDMAPDMITSAFDIVISYRHKVDEAPAPRLHEIRIQNKRFRYLSEFFQGCYDERMQEVIERHIRLQRLLGVIQDLNRDIELIHANFDELSQGISKTSSSNPLNDFLEHMQTREKEARALFLEFWRGFSLRETEAQTRYIIRWAMK